MDYIPAVVPHYVLCADCGTSCLPRRAASGARLQLSGEPAIRSLLINAPPDPYSRLQERLSSRTLVSGLVRSYFERASTDKPPSAHPARSEPLHRLPAQHVRAWVPLTAALLMSLLTPRPGSFPASTSPRASRNSRRSTSAATATATSRRRPRGSAASSRAESS